MGNNGAIVELHNDGTYGTMDNRASAHSQAQLQLFTKCLYYLVFMNVSHFAQANSQTKNCNRACLFSIAFLPTRKTKSGQC